MMANEGTDRRKRIVEAAFDLILSNGVGQISTAIICERAGVSRTTLYRHFPTREVLLESVIGYLADDTERRLSILISERPDPAFRLDIIIDLMIERQVKHVGQQLLRVDPRFVLEMFDRTLGRNIDIFNHALEDVYEVVEALTGNEIDRALIGNVMTRLFITLELLPSPPLPGDLRQVVKATFRALLFDLRPSAKD